jgi:hypothetical protein
MHQLKNGEEVRDGKLYGWTGRNCLKCSGCGEDFDEKDDQPRSCRECGGTGEEWGLMPEQPADIAVSKDDDELRAKLHCMCGDRTDAHGVYDGHSPVPMFDYAEMRKVDLI